ncbi:hypothetical protein D3C85_1246350 [compost metagenome]
MAIGVDGAAGRQGRDEIEDFLAPAFAQAQALEQWLDVVGGQGAVIQHMVDLRGVVQQCAVLAVQIGILGLGQAQARLAQVGRENFHPAHVEPV